MSKQKYLSNKPCSQGFRITYVQRDRDGKYASDFDAALKRQRVKVIKGAVQYPHSRAYVERFIGSIHRECLDHFLFFGKTHLDRVVNTWIGYYHKLRPHQGVGNELLLASKAKQKKKRLSEPISLADVRCNKQLGGLLKSYSRKAA